MVSLRSGRADRGSLDQVSVRQRIAGPDHEQREPALRDRQQRRAVARHVHGQFGRGDLVRQEHGHHGRQFRVEIQIRQWRCSALQRRRRLLEGRSGSHRCEQRRALHTVRRAGARWRPGFNPNATAPANYQFTYNNRNGELPSFTLANNQDLFTRPENGFFKSHWVFGDETEVENWSARADVEWDPEFIKSNNVTFSGGLRMAERTVDYTFGRYLADYHSFSPLDGTSYGADWTNYGYFQDGAIGPKACDSLSGGGAPLGTAGRPTCAVDSRFGTAPAFITPYQTLPGSSGTRRADQWLLGFGHGRRQ